MPRYGVLFTTSASSVVEVDADSPEAAREKARKEVGVTLCHQCAHELNLGDFEDDEDDPETVWQV